MVVTVLEVATFYASATGKFEMKFALIWTKGDNSNVKTI